MRVGAKVPNFGPLPLELGVANMCARLEDAGFDSLWISDHVVMPDVVRSHYPFAADGKANWATDASWYDAVALLGMMTAATTKVELGVAVLLLPLRHPVVFAKQAATIDALSGGRLALGIGAGWMSEEFEALNVPFKTRGSRLDEWIELARSCWTGEPAAFDGAHYQLPEGVQCYPVPAHPVPFLVGGHSPAALRRAGTTGDGWLAQQATPSIDVTDLAQGVAAMRTAAEGIGRDPIDLRVVVRLVESAGVPELVAERIDSLAESGVTDIIIDVDWTAEDGPERAASVLVQER
jgi:probable F420-dependent oxidoreductase